MKNFAIAAALVATLGLGACASGNNSNFYPVENGRTAGSENYTAPAKAPVRADRAYNRSSVK